jgi:hypothetical protein
MPDRTPAVPAWRVAKAKWTAILFIESSLFAAADHDRFGSLADITERKPVHLGSRALDILIADIGLVTDAFAYDRLWNAASRHAARNGG